MSVIIELDFGEKVKKMRIKSNKLINSNSTTIFLFLYGLIAQIVAFPVIYIFITALKDVISVSLIEALVFIWYCIPIVSVFSIIIAIIQIKERKINNEKCKIPLIGLILNIIWLLCYLFVIYMVFVVGMPFLFTK